MIIRLTWVESRIHELSGLVQRGFEVQALLGLSIREVLCNQLLMTQDYLDNHVNTIFLNGKSVDDVDVTLIEPGAVLALSASMPGFVGAAFRKGGHYALMRREISHVLGKKLVTVQPGMFILKLYNAVAKDWLAHFISHGITVKAVDLLAFLSTQSEGFWTGCIGGTLDGISISRDMLLGKLSEQNPNASVDLVVSPGTAERSH